MRIGDRLRFIVIILNVYDSHSLDPVGQARVAIVYD